MKFSALFGGRLVSEPINYLRVFFQAVQKTYHNAMAVATNFIIKSKHNMFIILKFVRLALTCQICFFYCVLKFFLQDKQYQGNIK